jgi:serine/threonine protein kinase
MASSMVSSGKVTLGTQGSSMHGLRVGSRARVRVGAVARPASAKWYAPEDVKVGKLLGEGSFGIVYEGTLRVQDEDQAVILKRAKAKVQGSEEMAEVERQLNERVRRHAADACAQYVGSCMVDPVHVNPSAPKLVQGLWLIWNWEGTLTLSHHLRSPSFPRDLIPALLGKEAFKGNTQVVRANSAAVELLVAQTVMRQLLSSLSTLHGALLLVLALSAHAHPHVALSCTRCRLQRCGGSSL